MVRVKIPVIYFFVVVLVISAAACPCSGSSLPSRMKDFIADQEEDLDVTVAGLGLRFSESPYIGKDNSLWPVPLLAGRYKNFFVDGRKLGYVLKRFPDGDVSLIGFPCFYGYDHNDSPFLDGMDDRDFSIDGGIRCVWNHRLVSLELTGSSDLLNKHQGQEIGFSFSREFYQGFLKPRVGGNWLSEDIVDYYYGVKGEEAKPGRPAYEGGPAFNFTAGLQVAVPIQAAWVLVTDVQFENLGAKIEDSPLVDKQALWTTIVGLVYRF